MNSRRPVNLDVGHLLVTTQQTRAITWLTLLGAALLSIVVPLLMLFSDVGSRFHSRCLCAGVAFDVSGP